MRKQVQLKRGKACEKERKIKDIIFDLKNEEKGNLKLRAEREKERGREKGVSYDCSELHVLKNLKNE